MENKGLFKIESKKSIPEFIESFKENAPKFNFGVRYVFNMKEEYERHDYCQKIIRLIEVFI